jgi:hypothetical protein
MASTPQHEFDVVLPTTDTAVPPNALVAGDLTKVDFEVTVDGVTTTYSAPIDAAAVPGSTIKVPFSAAGFTPVAGKSYVADAKVEDANGVSQPSSSTSWTQIAAAQPPAAPTGFSVS